jgi:hypothetical protein
MLYAGWQLMFPEDLLSRSTIREALWNGPRGLLPIGGHDGGVSAIIPHLLAPATLIGHGGIGRFPDQMMFVERSDQNKLMRPRSRRQGHWSHISAGFRTRYVGIGRFR